MSLVASAQPVVPSQELLTTASQRFPQFAEHARFLNTKTGGVQRMGGIVVDAVRKSQGKLDPAGPKAPITEVTEVTRDDFKEMLKTIDSGLRALPATAQVRRAGNLKRVRSPAARKHARQQSGPPYFGPRTEAMQAQPCPLPLHPF